MFEFSVYIYSSSRNYSANHEALDNAVHQQVVIVVVASMCL